MQLLKRVKAEPEFTLFGGLLRWPRMIDTIAKQLDAEVNSAKGDLVQYTAAVGAALLGKIRLAKLAEKGAVGGCHEIKDGCGLIGAGEVDISPDPRPWKAGNVDRISYPRTDPADILGIGVLGAVISGVDIFGESQRGCRRAQRDESDTEAHCRLSHCPPRG